MKGVRLKSSSIHGIGVYATRDFSIGEKIPIQNNKQKYKYVSRKKADSLNGFEKRFVFGWCEWVYPNGYAVPVESGSINIWHFLNEAKGNKRANAFRFGKFWKAIRPIKSGQEILIKYDPIGDTESPNLRNK